MFNVSVLGGCGLMGRGIALTLLQSLAFNPEDYHLYIVDIASPGHVKAYLRDHLIRFSEKEINRLRKHFREDETLVSNQEIIEHFVKEALDRVSFSSTPVKSEWVFEAIVEDLEQKRSILERLEGSPLIFSNTSAIPIHTLGREGEIVGYHFYNPPHLNRLVEVVIPPESEKHRSSVNQLSELLHRIVVESADVPGFIGNGIMIPEIAFACELLGKYSASEIDQATKSLGRPMGIFSLAEFVGLQTIHRIGNVMGIDLSRLDQAYPLEKKASFDQELADRFAKKSKEISEGLVERGVAKSSEDIHTVLTKGFGHKL